MARRIHPLRIHSGPTMKSACGSLVPSSGVSISEGWFATTSTGPRVSAPAFTHSTRPDAHHAHHAGDEAPEVELDGALRATRDRIHRAAAQSRRQSHERKHHRPEEPDPDAEVGEARARPDTPAALAPTAERCSRSTRLSPPGPLGSGTGGSVGHRHPAHDRLLRERLARAECVPPASLASRHASPGRTARSEPRARLRPARGAAAPLRRRPPLRR